MPNFYVRGCFAVSVVDSMNGLYVLLEATGPVSSWRLGCVDARPCVNEHMRVLYQGGIRPCVVNEHMRV